MIGSRPDIGAVFFALTFFPLTKKPLPGGETGIHNPSFLQYTENEFEFLPFLQKCACRVRIESEPQREYHQST